MKTENKVSKFLKIALLLNYSLLMVVLSSSNGTNDVTFFLKWIKNAREFGIFKGYEVNAMDYPPLASTLLLSSEYIFRLSFIGDSQRIKLFSIGLLLSSFYIFFKVTKNFFLSFSLLIFLTISAASLGYIDVFFLPFFMLSLFYLSKDKFILFSLFYAFSIFIKWQPIIFAPFFLLYVLKKILLQKDPIKKKRMVLSASVPFFSVLLSVLTLWGLIPIAKSFIYASLFHDFLSGNALNFNWILTWIIRITNPQLFGGLTEYQIFYINDSNDTLIYLFLTLRVIFVALFALMLFEFYQSKLSFENLLKFSTLGYLSYFMFNIGVHENHLFLVIPVLAYLAFLQQKYLIHYVFIGLAFNVNLFLFYGFNGNSDFINRIFFNTDISLLVALLSFIFFIIFYVSEIKASRYVIRNKSTELK